jgi:hypothetical protein
MPDITWRRRTLVLFCLLGLLASTAPSASAQGPPPPPPPGGDGLSAGYLHPLTPARLLDTRTGVGAAGKLGPGQAIDLQVTGRGGVPADAGSVVLNVTATEPTASGFLTLYPTGTATPTASNLNFVPGQTVPNLVVTKLGTNGRVRILNSSGTTHVVADVMGWYDDIFATFPNVPAGGARQRGLSPTRILDTRTNAAPLGSGATRSIQFAGLNGIPANATAAIVNVTVTEPTSSGFVTVYPTGASRPVASNLNFTPSLTVPNLVVVKVGAGGKIDLFNSLGSTHLVVDAVGYFEPVSQLLGGGEMNALPPSRILDTRTGLGAPASKIGPGESILVKATGVGGVLDLAVDSVVLNVTVTEPTARGFLTVFPANVARPTASNLNFSPGQTVPNLVVARVDDAGRIRIFNSSGSSHVVADVVGWFNANAADPGIPFLQEPGEALSTAGTDNRSASDPTGADIAKASDIDPAFAQAQAQFWLVNDPVDALEQSTPMPLLERATTSSAVGPAGAMYDPNESWSRPFPIWSQGYASPSKAIGRLVFWVPRAQRWAGCSATMVARNLAVTAAHCVQDDQDGTSYTNFAFFAGLYGTSVTGGTFTNVVDWVQPAINGVPAWLVSGVGYSGDYAFVRFGPTGGQYPGDITGWYNMAVGAARWMLSYGYPSEGSFFSKYCAAASDVVCYPYQTWGAWGGYYNHGRSGWWEMGWGSDMSGGSSGGPVFAVLNGAWYIVSVNSNGQTTICDKPNTDPRVCPSGFRRDTLNMWGPYFNQAMLNLYFSVRVA